MKTGNRIALFVLACFLLSGAQAKDPSVPVKAKVVLKTETSWDGKPFAYPAGKSEVTGVVMEIGPGQETGWHLHPVPVLAMVLEGELEVQLRSGAVKRVKAGEAFVEVVNTLHNGRNIGTDPVKLVAFYTGIAGQELTIKDNAP